MFILRYEYMPAQKCTPRAQRRNFIVKSGVMCKVATRL